MKTILHLLLKDLQRDYRRPWGIIILLLIPIVMSAMIAFIFSSLNNPEKSIQVHVAILDEDENIFSGMLRSMGEQGDAPQQLQIHHVETQDEGIRMLENRKVSALLIFPEDMSNNLIDGATSSIQIYKNPAQSMLPVVVEQGTELLAIGISEITNYLGPELKTIREMFEEEEWPSSWETAMLVYRGMQKVERAEDYLFPPLAQYEKVDAKEYKPMANIQITEENNPHD